MSSEESDSPPRISRFFSDNVIEGRESFTTQEQQSLFISSSCTESGTLDASCAAFSNLTQGHDSETDGQKHEAGPHVRMAAKKKVATQLPFDMLGFSFPHSHDITRQKRKPFPAPITPRASQAQAMQATHRMVVRRSLSLDPDEPVYWADVVAVDFTAPLDMPFPKCPICLEDEFTAPRITRCGHVFCYPCILRYLAFGTPTALTPAKRCPLCFENIRRTDLRFVRCQRVIPVRDEICSDVNLCLLVSSEGGANSPDERLDASRTKSAENQFPEDETIGSHFSRVVVRKTISWCLMQQRYSLENLPTGTLDESEAEAIDESIRILDAEILSYPTEAAPDDAEFSNGVAVVSVRIPPNVEHSHTHIETCEVENPAVISSPTPMDLTYVYQIFDGQFVFLHPTLTQCLLHEARVQKSLRAGAEDVPLHKFLPCQISGKVLRTEHVVMDSKLRSKSLNMRHVPYSASIIFVDIDIKAQLSVRTMDQYARGLSNLATARQAVRAKKKRENRTQARLSAAMASRMLTALHLDTPPFTWDDESFPEIVDGNQKTCGSKEEEEEVDTVPEVTHASSITFASIVANKNDVEAFPALGQATATPRLCNTEWGVSRLPSTPAKDEQSIKLLPQGAQGSRQAKKKDKRKTLLYSTNAQRPNL